jgi:hypothetical protein
MIIKRTRHYSGVAIAAFIIVAVAAVDLELFDAHQVEYSGFTAGL